MELNDDLEGGGGHEAHKEAQRTKRRVLCVFFVCFVTSSHEIEQLSMQIDKVRKHTLYNLVKGKHAEKAKNRYDCFHDRPGTKSLLEA